MSHILVRWPKCLKWDVYPIRTLVDVELGRKLVSDPRHVGAIKNKEVPVFWKDGAEPAPAYVLAIGSKAAMERKRSKVVNEHKAQLAQPTVRSSDEDEVQLSHPTTGSYRNEEASDAGTGPCCQHVEELEALRNQNKVLQDENAALRERVRRADEALDSAKMVKRLKRIMESDPARSPAAVVAEAQVDIGSGVLVGSHHLNYLKSRCAGQPTKFARALLRVLFTPEELRGKSLFGVASNAHKDKEAKEGLDRTRVNALIAYTVTSYGLQDDAKIKNTLSSLLVRECK